MVIPQIKEKTDADSVSNPIGFLDSIKKVSSLPDVVPKGVIFCYDPRFFKDICNTEKTKQYDGFFRNLFYLERFNNEIAIIGSFGIGAPNAVARLEELIAFGTKNFMSIGSTGSLQKNLEIGDIILCEKAIRDEGTSFHYAKASKYATCNKEYISEIEDILRSKKITYHKGTSWTTDAVYRETRLEIEQYSKEGVLCVDMEASALITVSRYRNVRFGTLFSVSDSLVTDTWDVNFHSEKLKNSLNTIYDVATGVLSAWNSQK